MTTVHEGGCHCGATRFVAEGEPNSVSVCHCRTCQRVAGGDSVAWAGFPVAAVSWLGDAPGAYASSAAVERRFCRRCGSGLSYQVESDSIDLALACFADPEIFSPEKEIWLSHRLSWNPQNSSIPGYQKFRSDG